MFYDRIIPWSLTGRSL